MRNAMAIRAPPLAKLEQFLTQIKAIDEKFDAD